MKLNPWLAVFVAALGLTFLPSPAPAQVDSVGIAGQVAASGRPDIRTKPQPIFRRRKIVEFTQPPIRLEPEEALPPPLITFRSSTELRAAHPPNPGAPSIAQALRQDFGKLVEFKFSGLNGPDKELLVRQATTQSLMSLAGRVYFEDRVLLSRDLLPKYFDQNGDRFVRNLGFSNEVISAGQPQFDLSLVIDEDLLNKDLEEKFFIYRPKLQPFFFIFLEQYVHGRSDSERGRGRKAIEDVILDRNLRYADHGTPSLENPDIDISAGPEIFLVGAHAAQRNEIEVVFTGKIVTRPSDTAAPLTERDWRDNTLEVAVLTSLLPQPLAAHLPIADLMAELDETLDAREAEGNLHWWDVGSIEAEAPLETLEVSEADRKILEEAGAPLKTFVPVERIGMKRNYYTPFYYASTRLELSLLRVDNGEVIGETVLEASASDEDRERAIQASITKAVNQAANQLIDEYKSVWGKTVLDQADYRIMATGVTPETVDNLAGLIGNLDSRTKVHLRSHMGDVAVLTVDYPGQGEDLAHAISLFNFPRFRIVSRDGNRMEIALN